MPVERRGWVTHGVCWVNGRPEELSCLAGRRQPSLSGTSRMRRESHVRICERLGVKFPGPTRRVTRISGEELAKGLAEIDGAPWAEWSGNGKPISKNKLSTLLKEFGVVSGNVKLMQGEVARGYKREGFDDAFARYAASPSHSKRYFATAPEKPEENSWHCGRQAGNRRAETLPGLQSERWRVLSRLKTLPEGLSFYKLWQSPSGPPPAASPRRSPSRSSPASPSGSRG